MGCGRPGFLVEAFVGLGTWGGSGHAAPGPRRRAAGLTSFPFPRSNIAMAAQGEPQVQFKVGNARELGVCCSEHEGL